MTVAHGQAIELPTSHFVGWTHSVGVRLPFPLDTREQEYVDTPARAELDRFLATDRRGESDALESARLAFDTPALIVYAVRSDGADADAPETKYVAVSGRAPNSAALVVLDADRTVVTAIGETELAASVASAVPTGPAAPFAPFESTVEAMSEAEDVCLSDSSVRTKRAALNAAGLPPDFVAVREAMLDQPRTAIGLLSAVSFRIDAPDGAGDPSGRPSGRSAIWLESPVAAYLSSSLAPRGARNPVLVTPVTAEFLFRSAAESISSCFD